MKYDFVPPPDRKPLKWPNGKKLAVILTTNFEYWDRTKDSPERYYPGGPGIVGAISRATFTTTPTTHGANTGNAWVSGGFSTCSTRPASHRAAR